LRFTLSQAAELVGLSKSGLYKCVKRGVVSAGRDESGAFFIDAAELFRAFPGAAGSVPALGNGRVQGEESGRVADLEKMVAMLEGERDFLRGQLAASTEQLAHAHEERRRLALLLEHQSTPREREGGESGNRLIDKLFRRGKG
jgi:hypothetical protein